MKLTIKKLKEVYTKEQYEVLRKHKAVRAFVRNFNNHDKDYNRDWDGNSEYLAVTNAFDWSNTKEGAKFWDKIDDILEDINIKLPYNKKLSVYKEMYAYLTTNRGMGFCYTLKQIRNAVNLTQYVTIKHLPELMEYRPTDCDTYWFPASDTKHRLDILEEIITKLEHHEEV